MNQEWKGRKVLVTGADGFIGSHLTERLLDSGAEVSVFVRYASKQLSLRNLSHVQGRLNVIRGNLSSPESQKLIRQSKPEVIFHLAADAFVPHSFSNPVEVSESNLLGTIHVLEASRDLDLDQLVCTSSSEIYGSALTEKISESHPLNPTSPYAASKAACDLYCRSYWNTYGLPVSIIRPFNTYGPRHTYDVIPKFISLALKDQALPINGSGEQSRDFMYVSDAVSAFLLMASSKKAIGQAVNFGTGQDYSINETAQKIIQFSGSKSKIVHIEARIAEVSRLTCDYSKARQLFGWNPVISLDEGLKKNIEWAKANL